MSDAARLPEFGSAPGGQSLMASPVRTACNCGLRTRALPSRNCCTTIRNTPIDTPDLAIFSQAELFANNFPPIWENPDVTCVQLDPLRLFPEAKIRVRNLSPTASAVNASIHFSTSAFGIGTRKGPQATRVVWIAPSAQVEVEFPLPKAIFEGDPRVGIHVEIEHPADRNRLNNSGSQMFDGGSTSLSGRSFDVLFAVANDTPAPRRIDLFVLQGDLMASVAPATYMFGPFEQITARLEIEVPSFVTGSPAAPSWRAVTVVGRSPQDGAIVGGLTRLLRIDT
ncbi:MAG: hypothetical protein QOC65_757 [Sphingomonadales bacterium]|nr:hypothetical protein [Sphingomonadales bacterium]